MNLDDVSSERLMREIRQRMGNVGFLHEDFEVCQPVVVSGPSGVGKGTIIKKLQDDFPRDFAFSVSHTTRKPRKGERDGIDYHFVSRDGFEKKIQNGEFVEFAEVHGNYYGSSREAIRAIQRQNRVPIIELDVQGARQLRKNHMPGTYVFFSPPSIDTLTDRLTRRGTDEEKVINKRVRNAVGEIKTAVDSPIYDAILVNKDFDKTYALFRSLIEENRAACSAANQPRTAKSSDFHFS